jgi:RND family efflux transporter MFP subunit
MKIKEITIVCLGILGMLTACKQDNVTKKSIQTVKVECVKVFGEAETTSFPGKTKAASEINLSFRIAGAISKINVKEGQFVRKGEILAEMDSRDYEIQLSATEAEYKQIKAEAERVIKLHEMQSVADNDYDKAVSGLQQITAKYNAHKNELADTKLIAPFDGYIQKRYFDKSEVVGAGTPVFLMISTELPEVEINIPAVEFIKRNQFDSYSCCFDVFPNQTFPLELISISEKSNLNQLYTVRFRVKYQNITQMPSPGMSAMVTIKYKPNDNHYLTIPVSSLRDTENGTMVWIYDTSTQTVKSHQVTVSQFQNNGTVIISGGLNVGDIVVTAGVHSLSERDTVKLIPETSSTNAGGLL